MFIFEETIKNVENKNKTTKIPFDKITACTYVDCDSACGCDNDLS